MHHFQKIQLAMAVTFAMAPFLSSPAQASVIETINFQAPIWSSSATPNAGNMISGSLSFDLNAVAFNYGGAGYVSYKLNTPGYFTFTTNGGLSVTQNITAINIRDKSNGISDYYVFDADVGTYGRTEFSRLELAFSNNSRPKKPVIENLDVPQTINLSDFSYKNALYYRYDAQGNLVGQVYGLVNSVSVAVASGATSHVPEPGSLALLSVGLFGFGVARRLKKPPVAGGAR